MPFPEGPTLGSGGELPLSVKATPVGPRGYGGDESNRIEARVDQERAAEVSGQKRANARDVRAAVVADDQQQIEMDFGTRTELRLDDPTVDDLAQVEAALGDLDRLEGEISSSSGATKKAGEKLSEVGR